MSLPTNFFIGRGGSISMTSLTVLLMGGGGGSSYSYNGYGGPGGVAVFEVNVPSGTEFVVNAGGSGDSQSAYGGGGGYSRMYSVTPGVNFNAVVGGGGGSGYRDTGGLGGGLNQVGVAGFDTVESISNTNQINDENKNSGHGGSLTQGGIGGPSGGNAVSGGSYNGGVYPYPGDSYPGGGGGAGYFGGGSGGGNNGQGGGPGGGGSGFLQLGSAELVTTYINSNHTGRSALFQREGRAIWAQNFSGNWTHGNMPYNYIEAMSTSERTQSEFHHQLYQLSSFPTLAAHYPSGNGANEDRLVSNSGKVRVLNTGTGETLLNLSGGHNNNPGASNASVLGQANSSFIAP